METLSKKEVTRSKNAPRAYLNGRLFTDYLAYYHKHPGTFTTQIDTVEGMKSDSKVILTFIIMELHFFYALVLPRQTAECVKTAFNHLYDTLGSSDYKRLFSIILTDRGKEFSDPLCIEFDIDGNRRSTVYFCNPLASYEKGAIESIHRLLRFVFPKGHSLDFLTQSKLDKFISNINSYKLRSNQFHTAYNLMLNTFGIDILNKLKIRAIDPDSIHLTPSLVK